MTDTIRFLFEQPENLADEIIRVVTHKRVAYVAPDAVVCGTDVVCFIGVPVLTHSLEIY